MDANTSGIPIHRSGPSTNSQMRPPPSPGNSSSNPNVRPPHPNQRPPPQQQQVQLQPPQQGNGSHTGRSPIISPFQKQDSFTQGQQPSPVNLNLRPIQQQQQPVIHQAASNPARLSAVGPGPAAPVQRPPHQQQQPSRPHPPPVGQQPTQFSYPGRPASNAASQGQPRPAVVSPQSQPLQIVRPPMQAVQQQQPPPLAHQPLANGSNLRPSASQPNLSGGPGLPQGGNRFTPPSPSLSTTRSPQIRPLQQSPQAHAGQGGVPIPLQQQPQQHQTTLRSSASHPHLAQQPGIRPPPVHGSPVQAHQSVVSRPPAMQQQPRPRPPQALPHGQAHPQQNSGQSVQLDMPSFNDSHPNGGSLQQQRPPVARPILDQMRQQATPNQVPQAPSQVLGPGQIPPNLNPTQRQPQRPPPPHQGQPQRQQHASMDAGLPKDHNSSPPQNPNPNHKERQPSTDQSVSAGEHGRPQQHSPQQQHAFPPNQRPPNLQQFSGPGVGQQQRHGPAGQSLQSSPPRPYAVPGSPAQRPLGAEIRAPGVTSGAPPRPHPPPPASQHQPQVELPRQHHLLPEVSEFKEPDEPLSDMDDTTIEEDDIEGGIKPSAPLTGSAVQPVAERIPPPRPSVAGGPPAGPPRGQPRESSSSTGSGPARVIPPSDDPTLPPASAFPTATQARSRVRPPPGNKEFAPYRPPERPSQAPVMYSQTGQPTFSQPFMQGSNSLKDQSSAATSMVPQGAEAASSSIRPREGGLQKRVFTGENNASKPVGGVDPKATPPSPKLHGQKGPAILSTSRQRSSSSTVKTLKTWAIRGGLIYLGYTAVFNCGPEATGVRGFYCKTTNGLGGLVKPLVAPQYNAYLGPHINRYVKPVAKQSHRIYLKVADPVVQGALSAAGTVYRSTAKKHVDSAKDQVISILPYPFKPKSGAAKGTDQVPEAQDESHQEDHLQVEKASRQPVHVEEPVEPTEKTQQIPDNIESAVDTAKETVADNPEETVHTVQEETADVKETIMEHATTVVEAAHFQEEKVEAPSVQVNEQDQIREPATEQQPAGLTSEDNESAHETEQDTQSLGDSDHDRMESKRRRDDAMEKIASFQESIRKARLKAVEGAKDDGQNSVKADETEIKESTHLDAAHEPSPEIATSTVPESEPISTSHQGSITPPAEPQELPIESHSTKTAESTSEFLDQPTASSSEEVIVEVTPDPVEHAASSSEDVSLEGEADNVESAAPIEEEYREHIPVATDESNNQAPQHIQQPAKDVRIETEQAEERHGHEREHHEQKEPIPEEEKAEEHNVTLEQQAAPVLEVEHDSTSKAHDEL